VFSTAKMSKLEMKTESDEYVGNVLNHLTILITARLKLVPM